MISILITSVIQYLLAGAFFFYNRQQTITWWMWGIAAIITFVFTAIKAENRWEYYVKKLYFIDIILSCFLTFFLKDVLVRIIIALACNFIIDRFGTKLENCGEYNNKISRTKISSNVFLFHGIVNLFYCAISTGEDRTSSAIFAAILILSAIFKRSHVKKIQQEDLQYKEAIDAYNQSPFCKALKISYLEMINDLGNRGEYQTSMYLDEIRSPYKVLFSVFVPADTEYGSAEIDELVITPAGIQSIEIKNRNLKWLISGMGKDAICYDKNGTETTVHSPFYQNANHIKALKEFIERKGTPNVKAAMGILGGRMGGYVVFGENTSGWNITNCDQGYCGFRSIGQMIQRSIDNILEQNENNDKDILWAMDEIYAFLKSYENNIELKIKHNAVAQAKNMERLRKNECD